jgi:hypothetical protein
MTISAFAKDVSLFPSISRPARIAILLGDFDFSCACPVPRADSKITVTAITATIHFLRISSPLGRKRLAQKEKGPTGYNSGWPCVLWLTPETR